MLVGQMNRSLRPGVRMPVTPRAGGDRPRLFVASRSFRSHPGVPIRQTPGRILLALIVLASLGCAIGTTDSSSDPPADVSGQWSGTLILSTQSVIRCCGGTSGAASIEFDQEGTRITGVLEAPGVRGTIEAWVRGATLSGYLRYRAGSSAGESRFEATVDGNEMLATAFVDSKLVLSRVR